MMPNTHGLDHMAEGAAVSRRARPAVVRQDMYLFRAGGLWLAAQKECCFWFSGGGGEMLMIWAMLI